MNKFYRIIFKALKIILGIAVFIYILVFAYVTINKKSIIRDVNEEISKKLNGKVSIGDVELSFFRHFPKISVLLNNVTIQDSMFQQHRHTCLQAEQVYIRLNIFKLIKNQPLVSGFQIERGKIYLYTAEDGYTNKYLFKPKTDSSSTAKPAEKSELRSVILNDVDIIIDDRQKEKLHALFVKDLTVRLDDRNDKVFFDTKANILVHSLGFNLANGSFLKEKVFKGSFEIEYFKKSKQLHFDSIPVAISGQDFNITAVFELSGEAPQFSFSVHSKKIDYEMARSLLTEKIARSLTLVSLDKPLAVDASISGPLKGGEPLIYVNWTARQTGLITPFLDFSNATFNGYYTNEVQKGLPRNDPNSMIHLDDFTAEWHELPIASKNIEILNLSEPLLSCDLSSDFPLTKLNNLLGSNTLQLNAGNGSVSISYKGPIVRNSNTNSFINGIVSFTNGNLLYVPRDVQLKNVKGQLLFKNSDVFVDNLQCNVLNNSIVMQGQAKNLLTLINTEPGKAIIDWNIYSPSLNLASFIYLLKPGKKTGGRNKANDTGEKIDNILEKANLHVKLKAANLFYKTFSASNVNASVSLLQDRYIIDQVSMQHAGGSINMTGSLLKEKSNYMATKLHASLANVDVNKVFTAFGNFGQDGITASNLEGNLTANVDASLGLDDNGKIYPSSLQSIIDFSLKDGALNNYEPVKKMQNIIFKKRDFDNIRFAELKDRLEVGNNNIKINRMEIQSTVLSFFVEGIYSMKGNTDLSIQVPLNNLKKRRADYNPENIGTDQKTGKSIFLRGRPGSDGNINFKIDLFNKYKKEKNN